MSKRITIYLNPPLAEALEGLAAGDSVSGRLGAIAGRYTEILRRARIASRFTAHELDALRDCCNGTWFDPASLIDGAVLANFQDALQDGLGNKWGIDPAAVAERLRALSYPEQVALVEDIEQFWRGVAGGGPDPEPAGE